LIGKSESYFKNYFQVNPCSKLHTYLEERSLVKQKVNSFKASLASVFYLVTEEESKKLLKEIDLSV